MFATDERRPSLTCGGDRGMDGQKRRKVMAQKCTYCNGTGRCKYCKGSGKANYPGYGKPSDKPCTWCKGSGVCQYCHGKGER